MDKEKKCVVCGKVYIPPTKPGRILFSMITWGSPEKRDLICESCHKGIGFFKGKKELLLKAATFLEG